MKKKKLEKFTCFEQYDTFIIYSYPEHNLRDKCYMIDKRGLIKNIDGVKYYINWKRI